MTRYQRVILKLLISILRVLLASDRDRSAYHRAVCDLGYAESFESNTADKSDD